MDVFFFFINKGTLKVSRNHLSVDFSLTVLEISIFSKFPTVLGVFSIAFKLKILTQHTVYLTPRLAVKRELPSVVFKFYYSFYEKVSFL